MDGNDTIEEEGKVAMPHTPSLTVALAISGSRTSKYVVKWALEKFIPEGRIIFKLLHVCPRITAVPTPMGNLLPISQVRDDVAAAYKKEMDWRTDKMLVPYKQMCSQRKVQVDIMAIEADDVASAISEEVAKFTISKLVIGASSHGMFRRKPKSSNLASRISQHTPNFCTVYVVSKGKLSSVRPATSDTNGSIKDESSDSSVSTNSCSSFTSSSLTEPSLGTSNIRFHNSSLPLQRFQALSTVNQTLTSRRFRTTDINHARSSSLDFEVVKDINNQCSHSSDNGLAASRVSSCRSFRTDLQSWNSDLKSISDAAVLCPSEKEANINHELEKLRIELRHVQGMYAIAQNETIDASQKLNSLNKCRLEEATKLKDIIFKEEQARELARHAKEKHETAISEAELARECAEREALKRKEAENKAARDAREKSKLEKALVNPNQQYKNFMWEEIVSATSSFCDDLKIGIGAYGAVYKCTLHHMTAAVKVLHSKEGHRIKQFQQELEVLSKIRHPHLLLLLGACPDHACLVYEYMENGNLDERLFRKDNTPPIPWFERYRIAWEVASVLIFLHNSKPKPIVHRDLKPANILLDNNFVSKIGDVGLSTMLVSDHSSVATAYRDTGPVGTLCYIDPEYQRTGMVSPKSDVYAFGMVILQLLTAKPAMALTHIVETALKDGCLIEILDSQAGKWPIEETQELAVLGLSCAELRRSDRPDLESQVLPVLERLKDVADRARNMAPSVHLAPPNYFICPILQVVMDEPFVAADGYTYDRKAIESWLDKNDKSPMTNLLLPNKNLIPNYTLLSAISEWKSKKK